METKDVYKEDYVPAAKNPVLLLPTCKGILFIPVQQIIRIQSIRNYSKIFFSNGKTEVVAKVLCWFQQHDGFTSFIRIHRTHLVNISFIKAYREGNLYLYNGETLIVARRKKKAFFEKLNSCQELLSSLSIIKTSAA